MSVTSPIDHFDNSIKIIGLYARWNYWYIGDVLPP